MDHLCLHSEAYHISALLPPNTHFMTRESLQPALCVLGGKLELGTTVTTVYQGGWSLQEIIPMFINY